ISTPTSLRVLVENNDGFPNFAVPGPFLLSPLLLRTGRLAARRATIAPLYRRKSGRLASLWPYAHLADAIFFASASLSWLNAVQSKMRAQGPLRAADGTATLRFGPLQRSFRCSYRASSGNAQGGSARSSRRGRRMD